MNNREYLEEYFIQFLYSINRSLLKYDNKDLYKALFDRYVEEYEKIPKEIGLDRLEILNKNFVTIICGGIK